MDRLVLEAVDSGEDQLTAVIEQDDLFVAFGPDDVRNHRGEVCISVAEQKAMDSYNRTFECSIHLTNEQARQLRDWLIANVRA